MKRLLAVLLMVLVTVSLASCGGEMCPEPLDPAEVGHVKVSDAIYSNYLYVIEDESAVRELTELYNDLRYKPADDVSFVDLLDGTLYMIAYQPVNSGTEEPPLASVWISPRGYVHFTDYEGEDDPDAGMIVYRLTSDFDEERLKALLKEYNIFD